MPRVDPAQRADPDTGPTAGGQPDGAVVAEPPELGDPYALPSWAHEPPPTPAEASLEAQQADLGLAEQYGQTAQVQPSAEAAPMQPASESASATPPTAGPAQPGPAAERAALHPTTGQAVTARPAAGSIADLQGRLARLPDGHPSAPHDAAGRVRPAATRLRQLELGLPAPERIVSAGLTGSPEQFILDPPAAEPDQADQTNGSMPADGRAAGGEVVADGPPAADRHAGPDVGQPPPDPGGNGHRSARPWQDPYASGADGHPGQGAGPGGRLAALWPATDAQPATNGDGDARGHGPATREPDRGSDPEPPRLARRDADRRDATRHDSVQFDTDRRHAPRQPAVNHDGTQRSPGDRQARESALGPQHRELAGRILAACRAAEGRNVFGGYDRSGLTPALQRIGAELPAGGLAPGSEHDTLKPADRFAAKLARMIARQPGRAPEELAASISDAIRYAFTFAAADYGEGTWLVHRKLKAQGFELEARRNRWDSSEYKGVFTRWRDPGHGVAFEVQFHTIESWAVHKQTHDAYVRITHPATSPAERARLRERQVTAAAAVQSPPGWMDIADFRSAAA